MCSKTQLLLLLALGAGSHGFTIHHQKYGQVRESRLQAAPTSIEELFADASQWDPIKNELDQVPVFACANDESQPLQYNVGDKPMAFFFLDIDAAKAELEKAKTDTDMDGLQLVPFPLGEIFIMGTKEMALVVPPAQGIVDAGAPPGTNPLGQQVPLFGCMDVEQDLGDGTSMTPLFTTMGEAKDAMNMALEGLEDKSKFDVTVIPLAQAIQMQASTPEKKFTYVPSESSLKYLRDM
uniref:Tic22-like family protein n=1 Tax=Chaetoceros debilis TaxID=122233 RepID=A0A7S3V5P5_9STRA|mmetsp:Transcript_4525/g.6320  ORF Transcript_4525/g.6320 Transcript_4525/m.6320 type:complete len:237 (+) Transcript_4525:99-809(+)